MDTSPASANQNAQLKQALVALKKMRTALEAAEQAKSEPLAIIGMSCRVPGGRNTPEAYWELLRDGVDAITEIPSSRWDIDAYYDPNPDAPGKMSTRYGGTLADVDRFDAAFFNIAPREAISMDPQQRLLLEATWEALERAGQAPDSLLGSQTGVFITIGAADYMQLQKEQGDESDVGAYFATGSAPNVAAGRISYVLGLQGPSIAIDTACSSSLVAIHLACQSLRQRECNLAIAGGANLILMPDGTIYSSKLRALAPDGRCKAFDAAADGYVRGEGCGIIVIKRLSDALEAGDPILALIRGTAVNQDGRSSGLTAPNGPSQEAVIRKALADGKVAPAEVGYIEAHGTGTSLGDPIEIQALAAVLREGRPADRPFALGSAKTNIGHTEAAAGILGLIKTVLVLQNRAIPPHLHFQHPSPHIVWEQIPARVITALTPWEQPEGSRIAGVSSFGISGTNAHIVLEEAPRLEAQPVQDRSAEQPSMLPLSARSAEALRELAALYRDYLTTAEVPLTAITYNASMRRSHHPHRLALVGRSATDLAEQLTGWLEGQLPAGATYATAEPGQPPEIVFVFSGQGSQWLGMGRTLLATDPAFRAALEQCQAALAPHVTWALLPLLDGTADQALLDDIDVIQPTLWAIQVALAAAWQARGIHPDLVIGHSMGEVAAATVAGMLSHADGARVIATRSRLLRQVRGQGAMAVVELAVPEATAAIAPYADRLAVAVSTSPRSTVLAGDPAALETVLAALTAQDVFCRTIKVDVASHSPQMDPLLAPLRAALADVRPQPGTIPLRSTVTGALLRGPELDASYWVANLRQPVQFGDAIAATARSGPAVFIEVSPHPIVLPAIEQGLREHGLTGAGVATLRREQDEPTTLAEGLAALYAHGAQLDWRAHYPQRLPAVVLPTYPWQRDRFWFRIADQDGQPGRRQKQTGESLLGHYIQPASQRQAYYWETRLDLNEVDYLADHQVQGLVVVPAAVYLEFAFAAAAMILPEISLAISNVKFIKMMILSSDSPRRVQITMEDAGSGTYLFRCFSRHEDGDEQEWTLHAQGVLSQTPAAAAEPLPLQTLQQTFREQLAVDQHYADLKANELEYGPAFQAIEELSRDQGAVLGRIRLPDQLLADRSAYRIHPVLIDACFQALSAAIPAEVSSAKLGAYVPVAIEHVELHSRPEPTLWAYVQFSAQSSADQHLQGDAILMDDQGAIVFAARGLELQALETNPAHSLDQRLYALRWRPEPLTATNEPASGTWLILTANTGAARAIAEQLPQERATAITVSAGQAYRALSAKHYELDLHQPDQINRLLQEIKAGQIALRGVIYVADEPGKPSARYPISEAAGPIAVLQLVQGLAKAGFRDMPRLWLVTAGVQLADGDTTIDGLGAAPLWGLGRTIAHEHPDMRCTLVDLSAAPAAADGAAFWQECLANTDEQQVVLRGDSRYVARLTRCQPAAAVSERPSTPAGERSFRLESSAPGILDNLVLREYERPALAPDEVEIEVAAASLNFIDVLHALGAYPGQKDGETILGSECAGTITAVGAAVTRFAVGDQVVAIASGSIARHAITTEQAVVHKPQHLSFEEAASLPAVFMTAVFALKQLAHLQPGERILIHSAASGTGLAALQFAQHIGAEIIATAGTEEKRDFLRSLGITHVADSRSLSFADVVTASTDGQGVDVVLNSLAGEAALRSLDLLGPYGRFLELGKKDIYQNRQLGLAPFKNSLAYFSIDLAGMALRRPAQYYGLFQEVIDLFERQILRPLPLQVFAVGEVGDAFRTMAKGHQTGKLVVSMQDAANVLIAPGARGQSGIRPDGTYLITGGLGGLGLTVAQWLASQGARHLALMGRSGPSEAAQQALSALEQAEVQVLVISGDVAREADVRDALSQLERTMPPLRGVIHAAGVLNDTTILRSEPGQYLQIMAPKIQGSWNLHRLTHDLQLDHFVLFSSVASLMGSSGQAGYAAANAFMDTLASYRSQQGLPALSINWGPWADVGLAAAQSNRGERLALRGMESLSPAQALEALDQLLRQHEPQVAVMALNLRQWQQSSPEIAKLPIFAELLQEGAAADTRPGQYLVREALQGAEVQSRRFILETHLIEQIAQVLRLPLSRLEPATPLGNLGFDSLMALELRNRLESSLGLALPATLVWGHRTISALAEHLAVKLGLDLSTQTAAADSSQHDEQAREIEALQQISQDEATRLLLEELSELSEFLD